MTTVAIFIILAGCFKGLSDYLAHHRYEKGWFGNSPSRKYKEGMTIPKFLFSTTILVFLTDAWHFSNMLQRVCWSFSVFFTGGLTLGLIAFFFPFIGFHITYYPLKKNTIMKRVTNNTKGSFLRDLWLNSAVTIVIFTVMMIAGIVYIVSDNDWSPFLFSFTMTGIFLVLSKLNYERRKIGKDGIW